MRPLKKKKMYTWLIFFIGGYYSFRNHYSRKGPENLSGFLIKVIKSSKIIFFSSKRESPCQRTSFLLLSDMTQDYHKQMLHYSLDQCVCGKNNDKAKSNMMDLRSLNYKSIWIHADSKILLDRLIKMTKS